MKVTGFCCVLLAIYFGQIECELVETVPLSECVIEPLRIYKCIDEDIEPTNFFDGEIVYLNDMGDKVLDFEFTLDIPINSEFTLALTVLKWSHNAWETVYKEEDLFCKHIVIKEYLPRAWEKLRSSTDPPMEEECQIDAGFYKLVNFTLSPSDVDVPASIYGRFKVEIKFMDAERLTHICQILEIDTDRKSKALKTNVYRA